MTLVINNIVNVNREIKAYQPGVGRKDFTSSASTYGELKRDLLSQGFKLENTTVSEGYTRITLSDDSAVLPTNINYRGNITNDLVILITPDEKPKSGRSAMPEKNLLLTRNELISEIKEIRKESKEAYDFFYMYTNKATEYLNKRLRDWKRREEETFLVKDSGDNASIAGVPVMEEGRIIDITSYKMGLGYIFQGINMIQNSVRIGNEVSDEEIINMYLVNTGGNR